MKAKSPATPDDMRPEYDFDYSTAVRGKYYRRLLKEGANVVVLEPDVEGVSQFGCGERGAPISTQDVRGDPASDIALRRAGGRRPPLSARIDMTSAVNPS